MIHSLLLIRDPERDEMGDVRGMGRPNVTTLRQFATLSLSA